MRHKKCKENKGIRSSVARLLGALVIALMVTVLFAQASLADISDGLAGYWPADGDANDYSGNGNHGTLNGITYSPGKYGQAFYSYGRGSHVYVPDSPSLRFPENAITIAAWVNPKAIVEPFEDQVIVFKRTEGSPQWEGFELRLKYGHIRLDLDYGTSYVCPTAPTTVSLNTWTHVAATYDNDVVKMYQDGVLVHSYDYQAPPPILDTTQPLRIGSPGKWWEKSNQSIDEVRIYDRALSECEIQTLAGVGTCNQPPVADAGGDYSGVTNAVMVDIDPDTLNLSSNGKWVTAYLIEDVDGTADIELDGSGSTDPDEDELNYSWTIADSEGNIVGETSGESPEVSLPVGEYVAELIVNDGTEDSEPDYALITIELLDVSTLSASDLYLNGVQGDWSDFQDPELMVKFDRAEVADTVDVGTDVPMIISGSASGVDYITVIDKGKGGKGK